MIFTTEKNIDLSNTINFIDMFKNCTSLTGFSDSEYTFLINNTECAFTRKEVQRLQSACNNFKFEDKDILRMRKITNHYIKTFHPEDLL